MIGLLTMSVFGSLLKQWVDLPLDRPSMIHIIHNGKRSVPKRGAHTTVHVVRAFFTRLQMSRQHVTPSSTEHQVSGQLGYILDAASSRNKKGDGRGKMHQKALVTDIITILGNPRGRAQHRSRTHLPSVATW